MPRWQHNAYTTRSGVAQWGSDPPLAAYAAFGAREMRAFGVRLFQGLVQTLPES